MNRDHILPVVKYTLELRLEMASNANGLILVVPVELKGFDGWRQHQSLAYPRLFDLELHVLLVEALEVSIEIFAELKGSNFVEKDEELGIREILIVVDIELTVDNFDLKSYNELSGFILNTFDFDLSAHLLDDLFVDLQAKSNTLRLGPNVILSL